MFSVKIDSQQEMIFHQFIRNNFIFFRDFKCLAPPTKLTGGHIPFLDIQKYTFFNMSGFNHISTLNANSLGLFISYSILIVEILINML